MERRDLRQLESCLVRSERLHAGVRRERRLHVTPVRDVHTLDDDLNPPDALLDHKRGRPVDGVAALVQGRGGHDL